MGDFNITLLLSTLQNYLRTTFSSTFLWIKKYNAKQNWNKITKKVSNWVWAEKRSGGRWRGGGCESVWECVRGLSDLTCSVGDATGAICHSYTDKPRQNEARQDPFQISWRSTRDQPFTHWWGKSEAVVMVTVQTERRVLVVDVSPTPNTPTSPQLPPHSSSSSKNCPTLPYSPLPPTPL